MNKTTIIVRDCEQSIVTMTELGIDYECKEILLDEIDSKDNQLQGRTSVRNYDANLVKEYCSQMKAGAVFPWIVVQKKKSGKHRVVCGRHRLAAMIEAFGRTATVMCAVVSDATDDTKLLCLSARENTKNGYRQSHADLAAIAAETLLKMPLAVNAKEHPPAVIHSIADEIGAVRKNVKSEYYYRLAFRSMTDLGLSSPNNKIALENLWRLPKSQGTWANICRAVSRFRQTPDLTGILRSIRLDKVQPESVEQEIVTRCESVMSEHGKVAFKRQLQDPVDKLFELLSLADSEIDCLPESSLMAQEKVEEIGEFITAVKVKWSRWSKT